MVVWETEIGLLVDGSVNYDRKFVIRSVEIWIGIKDDGLVLLIGVWRSLVKIED